MCARLDWFEQSTAQCVKARCGNQPFDSVSLFNGLFPSPLNKYSGSCAGLPSSVIFRESKIMRMSPERSSIRRFPVGPKGILRFRLVLDSVCETLRTPTTVVGKTSPFFF